MVSTRIRQTPRTLIADDQPDVLIALRLLLKNAGYQIETASSPAAVLEAIKNSRFDVVLMDLNYARDTTSGREGLDLITRIQAIDSVLPIVVMTAWGNVDLAVETMRRGVRDFVQKPWENSKLLHTLRKQIEHGRARRTAQRRVDSGRRAENRMRVELNEAREIQRNLMPRTLPRIPGFQLAAAWQPAASIGGDYVAAFKLNPYQTALCVADVVGKGLPAALLMSNMQAALKSSAMENIPPRELCMRLNRVMHANTPLHKFITLFYGVLDVHNRTLKYTNAGHNPPLLVRSNGEFTRLGDGGCVLGAFVDTRYTQGEVELRSGDRLLMFTDGVTEATNETGEQFGEERLVELLRTLGALNPTELQESILNEVRKFCGDKFSDDAALMIVVSE